MKKILVWLAAMYISYKFFPDLPDRILSIVMRGLRIFSDAALR